MRTGRKGLIRDLNRSLVLEVVRQRHGVSRAEIARATGLSPSTVTMITASLIAAELLVEEGSESGRVDHAGAATVGRPGTLLRVDPGAHHVIGVKLASESLTVTVTDLDATPLAMRQLPHGVHAEPREVVDLFETAIEAVLRDAGLSHSQPLGMGIGVPGMVDPRSRAVSRSPLPEWSEADLAGALEDRLGMAVLVDNDVNTLTVAEHLFGSGRGLSHLLVVSIGRGIGMGAVVDGVVVRGWRGALGEIGHLQVEADGRRCWCGRVGCLETVAAEPAIARRVLEATGRSVKPDALAAEAEGDPRVAAIVEDAGRLVGAAVATTMTILDPQRVVISGEGVRLGQRHLDAIRLGITERLGSDEEIDLVFEPWGDEAWARGAASLVLRELFHPAHLRDEGRPIAAPVTLPGNPQAGPARAGQGGAFR